MKMQKVLALLVTASLMVLPGNLQASEPSDDAQIVVTGKPMSRSQAHKLARKYTQAIMAPAVSDQNARWRDPLCIGVAGTSEEFAVVVIDRIEAAANAAGARVAKPGCSPNVLLAFTPDSDAVFAKLYQTRADLLRATAADEVRKLRAPGLPVRWFYSQSAEGLGGRAFVRGPDGVSYNTNIVGSRIDSPVQVSIDRFTALIDTDRIGQVSIDMLTDYLAFVILSRTRVAATPPAESIMNLFAASDTDRPLGMTDMDKAMLKVLYTIPINRTSAIHRNQMASEIIKEIVAVQ
jgi:hypothetical protein